MGIEAKGSRGDALKPDSPINSTLLLMLCWTLCGLVYRDNCKLILLLYLLLAICIVENYVIPLILIDFSFLSQFVLTLILMSRIQN